MIVKCKHCGRQNKLPTTGKAEDYATKVFKCSSCEKPLFPKTELAKYRPKPLKTQSNQQKTETPKSKSSKQSSVKGDFDVWQQPKPEPYKPSSESEFYNPSSKKIKKLEDEVKELKDDLYKKKQDDKKNIYFGITIVSYLVLSYFVGNIWSGWHLLLILGLSLMWNS